MKYTYILFLVFAFVFSSQAVFGQKFLTKPYREWTSEEVAKILTDSPWAAQYQSERGLAAAGMQQQARDQADTNISGRDRGNLGRPEVPVPLRFQLFSALPIRQAITRGQQLQLGYDKLSAEDKKKFDDAKAKFLECPICTDYYVIMISKWKDTSTTVNQGMFEGISAAELKGKIYLMNDKGAKLDFTEFTPPKTAGDAAVFFFKRKNEAGEPFLSPSDKSVKLVFANDFRDASNQYSGLLPKLMEFKIQKMVIDGNLVF